MMEKIDMIKAAIQALGTRTENSRRSSPSALEERINTMERELQTIKEEQERTQGLLRDKEKEKDKIRNKIRKLERQTNRRRQIKKLLQSSCGLIALAFIVVLLWGSSSTWAYPSYASGLDVFRLVH